MTEVQKFYVRHNYGKITNKQLAKDLQTSLSQINQFVEEEGLKLPPKQRKNKFITSGGSTQMTEGQSMTGDGYAGTPLVPKKDFKKKQKTTPEQAGIHRIHEGEQMDGE